jgi:hypothetical protein
MENNYPCFNAQVHPLPSFPAIGSSGALDATWGKETASWSGLLNEGNNKNGKICKYLKTSKMTNVARLL